MAKHTFTLFKVTSVLSFLIGVYGCGERHPPRPVQSSPPGEGVPATYIPPPALPDPPAPGTLENQAPSATTTVATAAPTATAFPVPTATVAPLPTSTALTATPFPTVQPTATATAQPPVEQSPVIAEILRAHNEARSRVSPAPSSPMQPLTWSEAAAAKAKDWASQCKFEHNLQGLNGMGENLHAATNNPGFTASIQSWVSESASYNYANNSCTKVCGHYTQVVWAKTTGVGCAVQECRTNSPFGAANGTWYLTVCNYTPAGNIVGEKPY